VWRSGPGQRGATSSVALVPHGKAVLSGMRGFVSAISNDAVHVEPSDRPAVRASHAVLCFWLVAAGVLALTATLTLWNARNRQVDSIERGLAALSFVLAEQTARTFQSVDLILQGTVEHLRRPDGLRWLDAYHTGGINAALGARISGATQVRSLFVVDEGGHVAYSAYGSPVGLFVGDRDYVVAHRNGETSDMYIGLPVRSRVDGEWSVFVSRRLDDASGHYAGVVAVAVPLRYFHTLYGSIKLDDSGGVELSRSDGMLMYAEPLIEERLGQLVGDDDTMRAVSGAVPHLLIRAAGPQARIVALRAVEGFPLLSAVSVDERSALSAWRGQAGVTAAWVVGAIMLLGVAAFAVAREIEREKGLKRSLRESEACLQGIIGSAMDAILTFDDDNRIVMFNPAAERLLGCSTAEAVGQRLERYIPQAANVGKGRVEIAALRADGRRITVEASVSQVAAGCSRLHTAILRDITARRRHEAELRRLNLQLRELSASLQSAREEERLRIARELHDDLGQQLIGLRMGLSLIGSRLRPDRPELAGRVADVQSAIDRCIGSVRRIATELRPLMLDDLGLFAAVNWLAEDVAGKSGLDIKLDLDDQAPQPLSGEMASAMFRILQESLNNVVRHAGATQVHVALRAEGAHLLLCVADDGRGMSVEDRVKPGSFGFLGMRERAWMLGGEVNITSEVGCGTTVEVRLPLQRPETEERIG
jgi:PAS domain S-box-containing protein